jgi:hypothetical protein
VALWLVAAVGKVANGRFASPQDIVGSGFSTPTLAIAIARAILQNTHEQVMIPLILHLVLATPLPLHAPGRIPLLVLQFSVGRPPFGLGYRGGASGRALAFGATFYPATLGALLTLVLLLLRRGSGIETIS